MTPATTDTDVATAPDTAAAEAQTQQPDQQTDQPKSGAEAARGALMNESGFWDRIMSDEPNKDDAKPEEGKEDKKPEDKADEKPKPAPKKKAKEKAEEPAPQVNNDRLIDTVVTAAVSAARASVQQQASPVQAQVKAEKDPVQVLGADFKDDIDEIREMEQLFPDKYSGLLEKFVGFKQSERDYIAKWKKENPHDKWDREDSGHDSFYEAEPQWSEGDRRRAQRNMIVREAKEVAEKSIAPMREQLDQERAQARIIPEIERTATNSFAHILVSLNPEFEAHLNDEDGVKKIEEMDPIALDSAKEAFQEARGACVEAVRLWSNATKLDARGNQDHARIMKAFADIERDLSALPVQKQFDNSGKLFATQQEYMSIPPAERAKRWTVGLNEVVYRITEDAAGRASQIHKERTAAFDSYMKRMGLVKSKAMDSSQKAAKQEASKHTPPAIQPHPIFAPPSAPRGMADSSRSPQLPNKSEGFIDNFGTFKS